MKKIGVLIRKANLFVGQQVDIVNVNNGERFTTYIISGEEGKGEIRLNGAARKVHRGDKIIIIAYADINLQEAEYFKREELRPKGRSFNNSNLN